MNTWEVLLKQKIIKNDYENDPVNKNLLIKIYENDIGFVRKNFQNISLRSVSESEDFLNIILSFVNDIELILFLIDRLEINHLYTNNHLLLGCKYNKNLELIKYLIEKQKLSTDFLNERNENCLLVACKYNENLEIIKYLIEICKLSINIVNKDKRDCLMLACFNNNNLEIIKYLIEDCKMSLNKVSKNKNNCLILACKNNNNLEIIEYLIECCKIDTHKMNNNYQNCMSVLLYNNSNKEILKYLIDKTDTPLRLNHIYYDDYIHLIHSFKDNYLRLNEYLEKGINKFKQKRIINIIVSNKSINTLILNKKIKKKLNINPFDTKFCNFKNLVDAIGNSIKLSPKLLSNLSEIFEENIQISSFNDKESKRKLIDIDYSKQTEVLFLHNNKKYYGIRQVVYSSIHLLKEMSLKPNNYDFTDPMILNVSVPDYVINKYIASCYENMFDIDEILPKDFNSFLNLIDEFPTDVLSIDILEIKLVKYMKKNSNELTLDHQIKNFSIKYQLKIMYLFLYINEISTILNKQCRNLDK